MHKRTFFLRMVVSSLIRRRSRMLTALLSVAVGAAVLLGLISIYHEVPTQLSRQFRQYGANLIVTPAAGQDKISTEDLAFLRTLTDGQHLVGLTPLAFFNLTINEQPFSAAGTDFEQIRKTAPYWGVDGRLPEAAGEVLLGTETAARIKARPGDAITLAVSAGGERHTLQTVVSGLLTTGSAEENLVYLSLTDAARLTNVPEMHFDVIEASLALSESELHAVSTKVSEQRPQLHPRLITRVASSEGKVLSKLQSLVWLTTLIIVLLTAVCVSTTMMAAAAERRREIGLKKALGAADSDIVREFMSESVLLGVFGGVLGSILGCGFAAYVTSKVFGTALLPSAALCLGCLVLCVLLTAVSSVLPILRAAQVDPVIVLRGE